MSGPIAVKGKGEMIPTVIFQNKLYKAIKTNKLLSFFYKKKIKDKAISRLGYCSIMSGHTQVPQVYYDIYNNNIVAAAEFEGNTPTNTYILEELKKAK